MCLETILAQGCHRGEGQEVLQLRKAGLELTSQTKLRASETNNGNWVAWVEVSGVPVNDKKSGKPLLFEGPTRYQAQCAAYRWLNPEASSLLRG